MRKAAARIPPATLADWGLAGPPVRFLTGARFVHQTIFCARSFEWACGTHTRIEIFSDGTLGPDECVLLKRALPHAMIADDTATSQRLDTVLPTASFPLLREMRETQPLMCKLLDLHAGLSGPALYLDSDMLFFAAPATLRDWLRVQRGEWFMEQSGDALVGERVELGNRLGLNLAAGVNSGILALEDSAFDWPALERTAATFTPAERAHKWAEQTLFAVHVSRRFARALSRLDYVLCHGREDFADPAPALRHYVHKAKSIYAAREWRHWLAQQTTTPAGPRLP